jgi:ATP-binding cassette subfamily F protein 3
VREERAAAPKPAPRKAPQRGANRAPAPKRGDTSQLERQIEVAEAALRALEEELADPAAWSTPKKSASSTARHEHAKRAVEELYARWEQVAS